MLADLDELILKCPDPKSRAYIREAVACYKAGAFRSAVLSTWIAVVFDFLDKIRFLNGAGDAEAAVLFQEFEKVSVAGDLVGSLRFEKTLLERCRDKLELLSHLEYLDLQRLYEDRNRCAHPSHHSADDVFDASPELARLHITNAVQYVLSRQPAQGKAAIRRLCEDIASQSFPDRPKEISEYLAAGALARPRDSLLRNFIAVLVKWRVDASKDYKERVRVLKVIECILQMFPVDGVAHLASALNSIVKGADDQKLRTFIKAFYADQYLALLERTQYIRIEATVEHWPADDIDYLELMMDEKLADAAGKRLATVPADAIIAGEWMIELPKVAANTVLAKYADVRSFAEANIVGKFLRQHRSSLDDAMVRRIIELGARNDQIGGSAEYRRFVNDAIAANAQLRQLVIGELRSTNQDHLISEE